MFDKQVTVCVTTHIKLSLLPGSQLRGKVKEVGLVVWVVHRAGGGL